MLKQRIITALILVAVLAAILFFATPIVAISSFAVIAALAAWEWGGLMRLDQTARILYALLMMVFCWQVYGAGTQLLPVLMGISVFFWFVVIPFWLRYRWSLAGNDFFGYALGVLVILPTWAALASLHGESPWVLLAVMGGVWVADIAAYFSGRAFGRHKLAPSISPGKTWEGVLGAVLGVTGYGTVILLFFPLIDHWPLGVPATLAIILLYTAVSIIGDLFESLLKRQAGIKDSSHLLPGHGGILDRIDSLTSALPFAALLIHLFRV
jgi:phosphatidate cytidylyltransferase